MGQLLNRFQEFQFQSLRFWIKNARLRVPKIEKSNKFMSSPITGSNGWFQKWLNFATKVWNEGFLWYVLKYVPVVYTLKLSRLFCVFKIALFVRSLQIHFLRSGFKSILETFNFMAKDFSSKYFLQRSKKSLKLPTK